MNASTDTERAMTCDGPVCGRGVSSSTSGGGGGALVAHEGWRPDWRPDCSCLYWYALPAELATRTPLPPEGERLLEETPWLDAVPQRWLHLTLCDVGFPKTLSGVDVDRVTDAVSSAVTGTGRLRVSLGPAVVFPSAVALAAGPMEELRRLQDLVRSSTAEILGPRRPLMHNGAYWPHISIGYLNRPVTRAQAEHLIQQMPRTTSTVAVDRLTLANVRRRAHHYEWDALAETSLSGPSRPSGPSDISRQRVYR